VWFYDMSHKRWFVLAKYNIRGNPPQLLAPYNIHRNHHENQPNTPSSYSGASPSTSQVPFQDSSINGWRDSMPTHLLFVVEETLPTSTLQVVTAYWW
jgi:hypothetical protein